MKDPATRRYRVLLKTGDYTVLIGDDVIEGDTTGGAINITLFSAARFSGGTVIVKKISAGALLTIIAFGSETIDGVASRNLAAQWSSLTMYSDGINWRTV